MTNIHRDAGLVTAGDATTADVVIIAVHGRGQTPDYLLDNLVAPLAAATDIEGVAWLLPAAAGNSWYPNGFLAPLADNQPGLDDAIDVLVDLELQFVHRATTVIWAGFSQGACLVTEHLARRPRRWGGLLAFTGGMIGPEGTLSPVIGSFDGMPAYFGVGDQDGWVPEWRVHESAEAYRQAGADVTVDVFPGRAHEICSEEIGRAASMLARVRAHH